MPDPAAARRYPTAQRLMQSGLARHADRMAVIDGEERLTYADLAGRAARLAAVLSEVGAGPEAPAAVWLPNRREFVELDAACTLAGITRVGVGDRLSGDECRYILEHSGARVLITTADRAARLAGAPETLLVAEPGEERAASPYERALAAAAPVPAFEPVGHDHPNYILYTSGTTGRPKGATHSHGGRAAALLNMLAGELRLSRDSVMVHGAPLTHGSGSKVLSFLAVGGCNVVLERFDASAMAAAIREHGGTHTFLVPTMLQRLVDADEESRAAVARLEQISFGGAPITPAAFRAAIRAFGGILTQIYGTSEAPHPLTLLQPADYGHDPEAEEHVLVSAGRASPMSELELTGDDGAPLSPGSTGELRVRSAAVMSHYWRDPDATSAVLDADGWYATGDVVRLDEDGLVTFQDRKRDLIISGGMNVYPSEVERVLAEHPHVREVAVVGYPDREWGESVAAYVVPRDPGAVDEQGLIDWSRARLASYKKPRQVIFLDAFPLGGSNKVLKRQLRDKLWQDAERKVN